MTEYRIHAYSRMEKDYGYVGLYRHRYQELQMRKRPWQSWTVMEIEEIPSWEDCFHSVGGSGWVSRFAEFGTWGKDGIVTPHFTKDGANG